ncbi:MAG: cytochrome c [Cytophagaceae bacterium]|nr:cytochrome c [Gemmatimonadaceae bacterium]
MRLLKNIALGLFVVVVLCVAVVYGLSSYRMGQKVSVTDSAPEFPRDSTTVARGQYLVRAITKCAECHGQDLGGQLFIDGGPLGTFHAPNLTSGTGGTGTVLADSDVVRAIRHGVGPGGRKLQWMPSRDWVGLADEDAAAIVAYIRSVPPVNRPSEASSVGPLGRALYVAGQLPLFEAEAIDHSNVARTRPASGVNAEYGKYLADIGGCTGCHGPTLSGGQVPGTPPDMKPASNLTPEGIGHYKESDFFRALREGKRPNGTQIDPFMPVNATKLMTDDDIRAVYAYLKTVPPKPFGNR